MGARGGFDFGQMFGVSLRLNEDVGYPVLVALSGLSSGLEHDGHQMFEIK
jgi:hypothetical protein